MLNAILLTIATPAAAIIIGGLVVLSNQNKYEYPFMDDAEKEDSNRELFRINKLYHIEVKRGTMVRFRNKRGRIDYAMHGMLHVVVDGRKCRWPPMVVEICP